MALAYGTIINAYI